jgi:tetratricopeptide (TPR) repeat protein
LYHAAVHTLRLTIPLMLALLVAMPARAQDGTDETTDANDREARGMFLAGQAAFDDARFEDALQHFLRAYELSGRAELLFNIGLAAERAGDTTRALDAFGRYLNELPDAQNRRDVEARITALEGRQGDGTVEAPAPDEAGGPGILPWIAIGAGGAAAIAGAVLLAVGLSDVSAVEDAPMDAAWSDYQSRHDRAPVFTGIGFALLAVGVAGAAVGVVLLVVGGGEEEGTTVSLGPGSIGVRSRF